MVYSADDFASLALPFQGERDMRNGTLVCPDNERPMLRRANTRQRNRMCNATYATSTLSDQALPSLRKPRTTKVGSTLSGKPDYSRKPGAIRPGMKCQAEIRRKSATD